MKKPFVSTILKRIVKQIGAQIVVEPEYGFVGAVIFKNGKKTFYSNTGFALNSIGASSIIKDKGYTKFFLKKAGYVVPKGQTFFNDKINKNVSIKRTIHDGYKYALKLGFPVIVKPNTGSQGSFVTKVHNKKEYYAVAKNIFERHGVLIVEQFCAGFSDYRIVVLDNKVISAYKRSPLSIVGDGKSSIRKLILKKKKEFVAKNRGADIDVNDSRIISKLKEMNLSKRSILKKDQKVFLLNNANLSTGGEAIDCTHEIHKSFRNLAVSATKDMGLRLCGVDILTKDITLPCKEYVILELNAAPGLDNYASIGKEQRDRVDNLYLEILKLLEKSSK